MPDLADVPQPMLEQYLKELFKVADTNGDGVLQPAELARVLGSSGFGFPKSLIKKVIQVADVNQDGVIDLEEFIPAMTTILKGDATPPPAQSMPDLADVPQPMLEQYLKELFKVADTNGDGVLQPAELARVLGSSGFGFPKSLIKKVIEVADVNQDGVIDLEEFIPAMTTILKGDEAASAKTEMPSIQDVPKAMLEQYLKKLFLIADTNGDGVLQPAEFARLLKLSGFNFSPEQIQELGSAADVNQDGVIEYEEFIPVALDILSARKEAGAAPMPRIEDVPPAMMERYLKKLFAVADVNGDGVLSPAELKRLLSLSGFNFSKSQIDEVMAAADTNRNGVIEYEEFIPIAMDMLMIEQDAMDSAISQYDETAARQFLLQGKTRDSLERQMKKMFLFADEDCSGLLDPAEFKKALGEMGLPLTAAQTTELIKMVDANEDGLISYDEFVPVAFELLVQVVAGNITPASVPSKAVATSKARAPKSPTQGWTTYSSLYESTSAPVDAPMTKVSVTKDNTQVASLEGRVLAVQSRRIIRSKIKDLFARLDGDKDGRLSHSELAVAFGDALSRRIIQTLDRNHDGRVTQYEMRRFFDDECAKAVESGVPEYKYLEGITEMLETAF